LIILEITGGADGTRTRDPRKEINKLLFPKRRRRTASGGHLPARVGNQRPARYYSRRVIQKGQSNLRVNQPAIPTWSGCMCVHVTRSTGRPPDHPQIDVARLISHIVEHPSRTGTCCSSPDRGKLALLPRIKRFEPPPCLTTIFHYIGWRKRGDDEGPRHEQTG
jgi:hypothetical protein